MYCSTPGISVPHHLLKFAQVHVHWISDAIQPSHPLMPSSSSLNLSQCQGFFQRVSRSYQVTEILESQFQHQSFQKGWFPLKLTGLISLLSKGLSGVFPSTTVEKHQDPDFITVQLSQSNVTAGKTIALTIQIFVSIVMSLLFNTMSRFEVFLSRGKHLLSSWMQSPITGILEPKKRKSVTTSTFFHLCLPWSMGLYAMSLIFSYLVVSQLFTFFWWLRW